MVKWSGNSYYAEQRRMIRGLHNTGQNLDRKFWPAMALYAILAGLIWFTLGEGTVLAFGRPVEIKLIPLFVVGMFVLRTLVAREAEKIRRRGEDEAS